MATSQSRNVFRGNDSMIDYYNPACHPPLPLVEIPASLNPYRKHGVHIYAKMMTFLPAHNVKALPALSMLQSSKGVVTPQTKTIVEYSSGSTVISMAVIARVLHGIEDVHAYLSNKTNRTKLNLMRFFGLSVTLFGGPSQPEPTDPRGGIRKATLAAEKDESTVNPNQYENPLNYGAHVEWTGPQILQQLPEIGIVCAGVGTTGTITGIGSYMKQKKPECYVLGVCTAPGDRVPGPRSYSLLGPVKFPWREAIDSLEEVGSHDSFRLSMALSREGLLCGPSSGFNLQGLFNFLQKRVENDRLDDLQRDENGELHAVFICCDLPYQYLDDYFEKLGEEAFHPIVNANLINVDKYRYDEAWELAWPLVLEKAYVVHSSSKTSNIPHIILGPPTPPPEASPELPLANLTLKDNTIIIDLRIRSSYTDSSLPGALSLPLVSLSSTSASPFEDSQVLERQWKELESLFSTGPRHYSMMDGKDTDQAWLSRLNGKIVVCVDYDGATARVASSVLRAKQIEAWSLQGGIDGIGSIIHRP